MKKSSFRLFPFFVALVCALTLVEKSKAAGDLYGFKNAEIILETTSQMNKITEKVFIGEGGEYERRETTNEVNAFGMKHKDTQINYIDRKKNIIYRYNPNTNEASATDMAEMVGEAKKQNMYAFNKEALKKSGGRILRKEKYKGLDCTVVEFANFGSTVWYHKKFPVRTISNVAGMEMKTELVSYKEGAAKDFRLPRKAKIGKAQRHNINDIMEKMKPLPK